MTTAIVDEVRNKYAAVARSTLNNAHAGVQAVAEAFGYTAEELASLPADANMGLSCGNPTATANLRAGEVVVDLGCGGGIDVLLAAKKVGPTGKAIGIDMTPEMIARATANAAKVGAANTEFHLAKMEATPLADASVDCLISNCVLNLAADKAVVFREMFRVLKPGGRVAVSDIALKQPLPDELAKSVSAYVGCVAGALVIDDYVRLLTEAGFNGVQVIDSGKDLNAYAKVENQSGCCTPETRTETAASSGCCVPNPADAPASAGCCTPSSGSGCCSPTPTALHDDLADLLRRHDVNEYAASVRVFALKPR
jgi:SAM-dependent methyltransferase